VVTIHQDTVADHKPQTRAGAALGCEKRLENPCLNFRWNAAAVVCDFDNEVIAIAPSANIDAALTFGAVDGVVYEIGPYLVQLAVIRHQQ
jgi:hypothetical protein